MGRPKKAIGLGAMPVLLFLGCGTTTDHGDPTIEGPLNRWASDVQWAVLQAQEHRDVDALCSLLNSGTWEARHSAALALASVQDTTSVPCLLRSLNDTMPAVRVTSAFALGLSGDLSEADHLLNDIRHEQDSMVRQALSEAIGRVGDENSLEQLLNVPLTTMYDSLGLAWGLYRMALRKVASRNSVIRSLGLLDHSEQEVRIAAAHALSRTSGELLSPAIGTILQRITVESSPEVRMALVRAWSKTEGLTDSTLIRDTFDQETDPLVRVSLLRALPKNDLPWTMEFLLKAVEDKASQVRSQAASMIASRMQEKDVPKVLSAGMKSTDEHASFVLMRATLNTNRDKSRIRSIMQDRFGESQDLYIQAKLVTAVAASMRGNPVADALLPMVIDSSSAPVQRTTALAEIFRMLDEEGGTLELDVLHTVLGSDDPGVLSDVGFRIIASEHLRGSDPGELVERSRQAIERLELPRDQEAKLTLHQAIAHLKSEPSPTHQRPPFNHPIDRLRLNALPNGREYVINTTQGEIRMITFVDEAPGSCVAFDSLVTAGYYNGKYFHRVVPNFVAQGSCPRGDGYGSMDWTLRTEVSLSRYAAGAVGMASAGPDTESCQFFITHSPAPHLDGRYTRFGQVVEGMDVVNELGIGDVILSITTQ